MAGVRRTIQSYLRVPDDWRVVEDAGEAPLFVTPTERDFARARRGDPCACVFAQALMHRIGKGVRAVAPKARAAVAGRWAYIPRIGVDGKGYIARMQANAATQRSIKRFDETGEYEEGLGYYFMPLAPSHRFAAKREYNALTSDRSHKPSGRERKRVARQLPKGLRREIV
jgi:hypothetical protein